MDGLDSMTMNGTVVYRLPTQCFHQTMEVLVQRWGSFLDYGMLSPVPVQMFPSVKSTMVGYSYLVHLLCAFSFFM